MYRVQVYHEDGRFGEMEIHPPPREPDDDVLRKKKQREVMEQVKIGIRVTRFSHPSERCPPLAVLTTVSSCGLCFKLEAPASSTAQEPLTLLHSSCLTDNKTAVMSLGEEELHLVAMYSENINNDRPCFWAFTVASGIYDSCLVMLNLRCLGIVFDLDETLVVANTTRTFDDKIEALQRRINNEMDPQRIAVMVAEMKRYQDDKVLLKQYVESDQVVENGEVIKVQSEIVPALSDNHQPLVRPLIRLPEKNIILTRINPMVRDTSVLVRMRPSWEELRSYLTAKGRKRFEVYVCTMAERDYALEMWRLLDPEGNLINANDLLSRIVCVKAGFKKSLFNVFLDATCHPKMALVIDDRLKVWDEKDQPRVYVVPAFAPYYSPQAEAAATPVLCVTRNVACGVRGGFFRDFDDSLLQRIAQISYENDVEDIPSPPDVSHYLVPEDDSSGVNGNKDPLVFDGMADAEVERRMRGDTCTISTRRRTYRRIESKAGSSRSPEESYLQFIKIETKNPPTSIPCSSSLTRRFFDRPLDSKCFNVGVGALDQLFIRDGTLDKLIWNDNWSVDETVSFFRYLADKKLPSRWSPLGSFFVSSNYNLVIIWGSRYYTDFGRLMRFNHYQVEEFDISPGEKYLVTYNRPDPTDPNGLWLKIFDVSTGTGIVGLNNADVADSPQWPVIRWAGGKDDTYFATLSKSNTVSVYETKTFNLLGKAPLKLDDVIDISWSPTEAVLAILCGEKPLKVLLLQIPDEVKLAEKEITAIVGDCKMHWQSNGEYLAVNTYGGFEFFRIKEKGIPTDFLKVDKKILAFAWEPSGHRFAVIYGDEPTLTVSFYSMKTPGKVTELTTLSNKQADSLFWSPKGNLVVLAGLKEGKLEFFDVDRLAQISSVANVKANQVVWNPSGEYVATVSTIPQEEFDSDWCSDPNDPLDRFTIWSSGGDCLFVHQCQNRIMQLDWRPYGGIIDDDMLKTQ